ncbi:MAG: quinone oxidoreductase, partial [Gemmatimonadota bacterium]|nr:quinone oxidoreductase [Gemmatimonadota bacterium]
MQAVRIHATGGPDALGLDSVPAPEPGPGEALVRVEAAGVNFI